MRKGHYRMPKNIIEAKTIIVNIKTKNNITPTYEITFADLFSKSPRLV